MVPSPRQSALFEQGQSLVHSIALTVMRRLPMRVELDDLIGYGQLGLAEAALNYQESHNTRFTTFAYYRIKGAIYDGVSKMSWTSRGRMNRLRYRHAQSTADDVAEEPDAAGLSDQLRRVYLTTRYDPGSDAANEAEIEDWTPSPVAMVANREIASKLEEYVKGLPRLPRILIESIYYEGTTLQDAANRLGISKSWASRVHAQTLQQLALSLRKLGAD